MVNTLASPATFPKEIKLVGAASLCSREVKLVNAAISSTLPSTSSSSTPPPRKHLLENKVLGRSTRNERKAKARAHRREEGRVGKVESGVEKFESAIDLHSDRPCKDYRMRGDVGQSIDDEDPYAEKDRLQKKFIRENPEDELSRVLWGSLSPTSSTSSACPAGITDTCPAGTTDICICPVEEVPAAEWRLTSIAATRFLPRVQDSLGQVPVEEQHMIQALTDSSFNSVCVCL